MEKGNLFFEGFRKIYEGGVEGGDFTAAEVFEEAAEGYKVVGLGEWREFFFFVIFEAVKPEAVAAKELWVDVGRF